MNYKQLKADYESAIALLVPESATFEADKEKLSKEFSILVSQQTFALKKAVSTAQSAMLTGKRDDILINAEKYHKSCDELKQWEDDQKTPEQIKAEEEYEKALAAVKEVNERLEKASENLKKLFPESPSVKKERTERTSHATVKMTVELKEEVIRLKKAGKRNIEIAEITGLNNGQISPILQKAGLTESRG